MPVLSKFVPAMEQKVYAAFKDVFSASNPEVPNADRIRHRDHIREICMMYMDIFLTVLEKRSIEEILQILERLLREGVFTSELAAKQRFPDFFRGHFASSARQRVAEGPGPRYVTAESRGEGDPMEIDDRIQNGRLAAEAADMSLPDLFPTRLRFKTQFILFKALQHLLEESLYFFLKENMPHALGEMRLHNPLMLELDRGNKCLLAGRGRRDFPLAKLRPAGEEFEGFINRIDRIRHIATHRDHWFRAETILDFCNQALKYLYVLKDEQGYSLLEKFIQVIRDQLADFEQHKRSIQKSALEKLETADRLRQMHGDIHVVRVKAAVREGLLESDNLFQIKIGATIERYMFEAFAATTYGQTHYWYNAKWDLAYWNRAIDEYGEASKAFQTDAVATGKVLASNVSRAHASQMNAFAATDPRVLRYYGDIDNCNVDTVPNLPPTAPFGSHPWALPREHANTI